jgi:DNA-directed RNA polymerase subunit RPC12/RpoP
VEGIMKQSFEDYMEENAVLAECLKCGMKVLVNPKDTNFNGNIKHYFYETATGCDGRLVKKVRFA